MWLFAIRYWILSKTLQLGQTPEHKRKWNKVTWVGAAIIISESVIASVSNYFFKYDIIFISLECLIWCTSFGFLILGLHSIRTQMKNDTHYTLNTKAFGLLILDISLAVIMQIFLILVNFYPENRSNYDQVIMTVYYGVNIVIFFFQVILILIFNQLVSRVLELRTWAALQASSHTNRTSLRTVNRVGTGAAETSSNTNPTIEE